MSLGFLLDSFDLRSKHSLRCKREIVSKHPGSKAKIVGHGNAPDLLEREDHAAIDIGEQARGIGRAAAVAGERHGLFDLIELALNPREFRNLREHRFEDSQCRGGVGLGEKKRREIFSLEDIPEVVRPQEQKNDEEIKDLVVGAQLAGNGLNNMFMVIGTQMDKAANTAQQSGN